MEKKIDIAKEEEFVMLGVESRPLLCRYNHCNFLLRDDWQAQLNMKMFGWVSSERKRFNFGPYHWFMFAPTYSFHLCEHSDAKREVNQFLATQQTIYRSSNVNQQRLSKPLPEHHRTNIPATKNFFTLSHTIHTV